MTHNINELEEKYLEAKKAYYNGAPIMSDFEFDDLESLLKELGSHIIEVVDGDETEGQRFQHLNPMLSLEKIQVLDINNFPLDDIQKFFNKKPTTYIEASPKLDGNAISLIYKNGNLFQALTRGAEKGGLDRTNKIKKIVPNKINIKGTVEIRGEIVIKTETFYKKYFPEFANPRNFVAGKVSQDDITEEVLNDLDFIAYHLVLDADNKEKQNHAKDTIKTLETLGFNKEPIMVLTLKPNAKEEFETIFNQFTHYRENVCPYQLDGFVLKFPEELRLEMGETSHHPKWATAIKFPPKEAKTIIKDISWQLKTTGRYTPIAILQPVDLDGSMVSRASLHNYGKVLKENAFVGAEVIIKKMGDIIPQIYKIIKPSTTNITNHPENCISCGTKLEIIKGNLEDTLHLMCMNDDCEAKDIIKLEVGIKVLKIEEIGGPTVEKLFAAGIRSVKDLFDKNKFNKENLIARGQFKDGRNLEIKLNAVSAIKEIPLECVIESLKIKDAGTSVSKQIARFHCGISHDFKGLNKDAIKRLTDKTSNDYKKLEEFMNLLKLNGIKIVDPIEGPKITSDTLTYELTGSPSTHKTKAEFMNHVKDFGFVHKSLNKDTKVLITDSYSSSSSKMGKANKLGVEILTYEDFISKYCK